MNRDDDNAVLKKSYEFALLAIRLCKKLTEEQKEYILSKQLLRSGTSIGANVTEAQSAESKSDFVHKLNIALKEARESKYWLRLLLDGMYAQSGDIEPLLAEIEEIISLLVAIITSSKRPKNNSAF
ncbi:four helix bundle protein [Candidatus Peregrinibacteria bacterium CG10_big_fil_rev_8_21_14_0_10_55_24]|nr:MAG: four helix bundle protein [Candidatus Peregrinibacteria bacterium CG10_big_fil_rev_8_21_14_0_10_55_24]